jgi:DNA modification methylase
MKVEDFKTGGFKCQLLLGDAIEVLKDIPENTFHMAVTSPPYWDQRDYRVKGQLGQEETPEEYIENLVAICREVRRTLRPEGTFWLNIGDGYCKKTLKESNRSEIIWRKTNPMPESQRNRPAKCHEHLFLLSKSGQYFHDAEAIADEQKEISVRRAYSKNSVSKRKDADSNEYAISGKAQDKTYKKMQKMMETMGEGYIPLCNKKDVWDIATADNKIKHFAMYPDDLVKPCILAGSSSKGCCPKCQAPWDREWMGKWKPTCGCGEKETKECIVLDPFNGSGTTGRVCKSHHRKYVGIDISEEYLSYARSELIGNKDESDAQEIESIEEIKEI